MIGRACHCQSVVLESKREDSEDFRHVLVDEFECFPRWLLHGTPLPLLVVNTIRRMPRTSKCTRRSADLSDYRPRSEHRPGQYGNDHDDRDCCQHYDQATLVHCGSRKDRAKPASSYQYIGSVGVLNVSPKRWTCHRPKLVAEARL